MENDFSNRNKKSETYLDQTIDWCVFVLFHII